jgi:hypothetical protein
VYNETIARWHAIDLFFGLAYLSRRGSAEYPAADIAAAGQPLHGPHLTPGDARALQQQLREIKRHMLYCQGLRHHKPELQRKHWRITTGLGACSEHMLPVVSRLCGAQRVCSAGSARAAVTCLLPANTPTLHAQRSPTSWCTAPRRACCGRRT